MSKVKAIYWAYRNKITNKFLGVVHMPALGKKKGDVLISYITEPFTNAPWEPLSNYHTMYWECYELARILSEKGYSSDIIDSKNTEFTPRKPYKICIDSEKNLERFLPYLPKDCKKVFFEFMSDWKAYNEAEESRLLALEKRRGVRMIPRRKLDPSKNGELADYIIGFGNKTIFKTFEKYNKPVIHIPISSVKEFDYPENKDFSESMKNFVWMGGGGAVLKGLDITLEAFSKMPEFNLHVLGPASAEKDFTEEYKKELYETPNINYYGRVDVTGEKFKGIIDKCSAVVYPSGAEGTSGTIVLAMHAGLIPIISPETGVDEASGYIPLENPTPESIIETITKFSKITEVEAKKISKKTWEYTRNHYTRKAHTDACKKFIEKELKI